MATPVTTVIAFIFAIFPLVSDLAVAHEGEDHGAAPAAAASGMSPRTIATSDSLELVAVVRHGELLIYLDRFETNEPVEGATIEVETPVGPRLAATQPNDAYRVPAEWAKRPGTYDLIFTVTVQETVDVLTGTLVVPEPVVAREAQTSWLISPAFADGIGHKVAANGTVIVALVIGFVAGVGLMLALRRGRAAAAVFALAVVLTSNSDARAHDGHDENGAKEPTESTTTDVGRRLPDGAVLVPKPTQRILAIRTVMTVSELHRRSVELPGRIVPDPNASGYVQAVVSGRLSPPPGGFPKLGTRVNKGDVLVYLTPPLQAIDQSDMRQRQGELDQQISIIEARIRRYDRLAQSGAVTQVQLDEARIELRGLQERRAALDHVRREPQPLIAPVSGVVAAVNAVAGQVAQPNTVVLHILDRSRLWVEALSFEALDNARNANARTGEGRSLALSYQGAGLTDRNQAIPVHFSIDGDTRGLRIGQLVTVLAQTDEARQGIAIPRTSVLRGPNGQAVVYEHVEAERFVPREVRSEPLDGERVVITAGISEKARVVTQGAELLNQMR